MSGIAVKYLSSADCIDPSSLWYILIHQYHPVVRQDVWSLVTCDRKAKASITLLRCSDFCALEVSRRSVCKLLSCPMSIWGVCWNCGRQVHARSESPTWKRRGFLVAMKLVWFQKEVRLRKYRRNLLAGLSSKDWRSMVEPWGKALQSVPQDLTISASCQHWIFYSIFATFWWSEALKRLADRLLPSCDGNMEWCGEYCNEEIVESVTWHVHSYVPPKSSLQSGILSCMCYRKSRGCTKNHLIQEEQFWGLQ